MGGFWIFLVQQFQWNMVQIQQNVTFVSPEGFLKPTSPLKIYLVCGVYFESWRKYCDGILSKIRKMYQWNRLSGEGNDFRGVFLEKQSEFIG